MNAETRAEELFPLAFGETLSPEQAAFRDRIAAALRQAENDKLEEAARMAENPGFIQARDTEWDMGVNYAKPFIANAIRSLKTPKD